MCLLVCRGVLHTPGQVHDRVGACQNARYEPTGQVIAGRLSRATADLGPAGRMQYAPTFRHASPHALMSRFVVPIGA